MEKDFLLVNVKKGTCMISKALPAKVSQCYKLIHLQVFSNRIFNSNFGLNSTESKELKHTCSFTGAKITIESLTQFIDKKLKNMAHSNN